MLSIAYDALLNTSAVCRRTSKRTDEADELTDKAQQCSNAIEEIVDVSDTALTELISAVVPLLNILTMIAAKHPLGRFIVPIIATIGADLIERTNDTIVNTCRDRDSAIEQCYDKFEESCTKVCERQLPETAPDPALASARSQRQRHLVSPVHQAGDPNGACAKTEPLTAGALIQSSRSKRVRRSKQRTQGGVAPRAESKTQTRTKT